MSGSGKTTLSRGLCLRIGQARPALTLHSDVERKRLFGHGSAGPLPDDAYRESVTRQVYDRLYARAAVTLAEGVSVIVDGVFARLSQRRSIARCAGPFVTFHGFWLEAPLDVLLARVAARDDDASDATSAVVRRQAGFAIGPIDWIRLNAAEAPQTVLKAALTHLHAGQGTPLV